MNSSSFKMFALSVLTLLGSVGCSVESTSTSSVEMTSKVDQKIFVDSSLYRSPRMIVGTTDSFTPDQLGHEKGTLGQECWGGVEGTESWCSSPELSCRKEDNKCWCDCTSGALVLGDSPCTKMCEHTSCLIQNMPDSEESKPVFGRLEVFTRSNQLSSRYYDSHGEGWVDLAIWNCMPFEPSQKCDSEKGGCSIGLECVGEPGKESCQCDCWQGQLCHDSQYSLPSMTQQGVDHCTAVCEKQLCGFKFNPNGGNNEDPLSALTPMFLTCKQSFPGESLQWQYDCLEKTKILELKSAPLTFRKNQ